ncbi:hypothetical protein BKA67DRAFT_657481 [Truncatella angustata]|uniref:F-box domain-containing protein n=1 Tax=Truncatella angustata TaxID=152316 RepID=A0A9P8UP85_9PEZI|nr:uncharacterized protein BKA67DRAFT_657481 [Truncatella angustata]KAH6655549.1 hypothetical protein BKA67DRAFT_657481 [Truncatella angustata]
MDKLPPEILGRIISFLIPDNGLSLPITSITKPWKSYGSIAHFATVSKLWQRYVERLTFKNLFLSTVRLSTASRIITSQRLEYVRSIDLEVILETYDDEATCRVENEAEKARNNEQFTCTVIALFALLRELDMPKFNSLHDRVLRLRAYSPSDPWRRDDWPSIRKTRVNGLTDNILEARFDQSYLEFIEPLDSSINTFSIFEVPDPVGRNLTYRRISPSACCSIAAKLGKLNKIIWHLSDNEKKDIALRKTLRQEFSEQLGHLPLSLKHMVLRYTRNPPRNHTVSPASILGADGSGEDDLSTALHDLCKRLVTADIEASLENSFFTPIDSIRDSNAKAQWPDLQTLNLTLSAVTPSGKWLFNRHPDAVEDEDPWIEEDNLMDLKPDTPAEEDWRLYEFRGSPSVSVIKPWFLAAAEAARNMPSLLELKIVSGCGTIPKPYRAYCALQYSVRALLLEITSTPVLDVDLELEEAWRDTARVQLQNRSTLTIEYKEAKDHRNTNTVSLQAQGRTTQRPVFGSGPAQNNSAVTAEDVRQQRPVFGAQGTGLARPIFGAQGTGLSRPVFGAQQTSQNNRHPRDS